MTGRRLSIVGLVLVLGFAGWWRGHTIAGTIRERVGIAPYPVVARSEPLDCDEAIYAYIGKRLIAGDVMYRDLTENKPPLGYWLYALAVAIGGANETTIRVMPLPMVLLTITLAWSIAGRIGGPTAAVAAAFVYALMSTDPFLYGNGANMEHAVNLFATAGLWFLVRGWDGTRRRSFVLAGICVGLASLVKQVAVASIVVFVVGLMVRGAGSGTRSLRSRTVDIVALASGFLATWAVAVAILLVQGAGQAAFDDIILYGGALARDTPRDPLQYPFLIRMVVGNTDPVGLLPWPFGKTRGRAWWAAGCWPLWGASVVSTFALIVMRRGDGRLRLVGWWTVSAWVAVALPGLFWQHYYLLPTPGVAIGIGWALAAAMRGMLARRPLPTLASLLLLAAIGKTIQIQVREYLMVPPEVIARDDKGGGQWVVLREVGREIATRTAGWPDPHLAVWGIHSPLNFYSKLDNVTPQVFTDPLVAAFPDGLHAQVGPRLARTLRDYREQRPDLIFVGVHPFPALVAFLRENYVDSRFAMPGFQLRMQPDGQGLWVRRDRAESFRSAGR